MSCIKWRSTFFFIFSCVRRSVGSSSSGWTVAAQTVWLRWRLCPADTRRENNVIMTSVVWFQILWSLFLGVQLTINQQWFRAIADPVHRRIYAALGGDELVIKNGKICYLCMTRRDIFLSWQQKIWFHKWLQEIKGYATCDVTRAHTAGIVGLLTQYGDRGRGQHWL